MEETEPDENSNPNTNLSERKQRISCYLVTSSIVCFMGSPLQFGYNLAVINAPQLVS